MTFDVRTVDADGAIMVFGGPCGNLQATLAVLAEAEHLAIPPERVICTGDIVAFFGEPAQTLKLVRESGIHVVMGNSDRQLGHSDDSRRPSKLAGTDRDTATWRAFADAHLMPDDIDWLGALPQRIELHIGDLTFSVIHTGAGAAGRSIFASSPALAKKRQLERAGCDGIIAGAGGLPFTQVIDGRLWHNPGIVGMPAHDGTPRVWCSVLTPGDGGIEITHRALSYDHAAAANAVRRAGLPSEYEAALRTGIWPSSDVLPQQEIHAAGIPLKPGAVVWNPDPKERNKRRGALIAERTLWPTSPRDNRKPLSPDKFKHPGVTAKGEQRARVPLRSLDTLWFNTGTLCNITCRNCYIESSPRNDRLVYLTLDDVRGYLDEIARNRLPTREIGFTGGEPFLNPHFLAILEECLSRGFHTLTLTNAMRPMQRHKKPLLALKERYGERLSFRVSLDHFNPERHEEERGVDTFEPAMAGLSWLSDNGFEIAVAGRSMWGETSEASRKGFAALFADRGIRIDARNPAALVLFPEMDEHLDVPEITTACWDILQKSPDDMMCATSRMVVKRKGADAPVVLACTLLAYEPQFELGATLKEASRAVPLNHAHCAKFCVLGGASCSPTPETAAESDEPRTRPMQVAGAGAKLAPVDR